MKNCFFIVLWTLWGLNLVYGQPSTSKAASGLIGFTPLSAAIIDALTAEGSWEDDDTQAQVKAHNDLAARYPFSRPYKFVPKIATAFLGPGHDGDMELVLHFENSDFKLTLMLTGLPPGFFKEQMPIDNKTHPHYFKEAMVQLFAAPFLGGSGNGIDYSTIDPDMAFSAAVLGQQTGPYFGKASPYFHIRFTHADRQKVSGSLEVTTGTELPEIEAGGGLRQFVFSLPVTEAAR